MSTHRKGYHHYYDFFVAKATTENKYGTFKSPMFINGLAPLNFWRKQEDGPSRTELML